ncbi:MAG: hypothetical protein K0Q78_208 [Cellvibrio sp.]|jgi:hypothetical protein|nr:hypothetical protein [Cellvibrio sp.]
MQARNSLLFASTLILSSTIAIAPCVSAQNSNLKPSALGITKLDDKTATISAQFSTATTRDKRVGIFIGKDVVTFVDDGTSGDLRGGDGLFTTRVEFDFDAFTKANTQLAKVTSEGANNLFAPGGRQQIKQQRITINGESLELTGLRNGKEQIFTLPFDPSLIKDGQPIALPLFNVPIGLPTDADPVPAAAVSIPRSLMITDVNVVNDPGRTWACPTSSTSPVGNAIGEWTFWRLMENMANGTSSTSDYIKALFKHWAINQTINGFNVAARPGVYQEVIKDWEIRSGGPGATLLPQEGPFRLLGIVLRADLRGGTGPYAGGDAGEGRFVFALHDGNCNNLSKTLILEYKVPIEGCTNIRTWAQKWIDLAGSANYNNDLESLTNVFTAAGANPASANQSAISQVRTNELLPGSPFWELREFVLPASGGNLVQTDVKQEPHLGFNNSTTLASYINNNWPLLVGPPSAQHAIPLSFLGNPFAAGSAPVISLWNAPAGSLTVPLNPAPVTPPPATVRDDALFELALNTCSGCHMMETGTPFAHLDYNSVPGMPAQLSGFLTGISIPDPRNPAVMRNFNDLDRRAADLAVAASMSCGRTAPIGNLLLNELSSPAKLRSVH